MKTAILAALATGLLFFGTGCSNACDDAIAHIEDDCGISIPDGYDSEADCEGAAECAAGCISDASCETLKGEDADGLAKYQECVIGCA